MNKGTVDKRAQATKLAKAAGLLDFWGKPTDEYKSLIMKVTGKDRMSIMTPAEADRFLEALESLPKAPQRRPHLASALVVAFLLLIATLDLPYGYYTFLRWVTCGMAAFTAFMGYQWEAKWVVWLFIPVAILFNPFVPIYLTKEIWQPIDLVCAILFGISALMLKSPLVVKP